MADKTVTLYATDGTGIPMKAADQGDGTYALVGTTSPAAGYTPYHLVSAATTNATSVKASAGKVGAMYLSNNNASPRYVKFYNKASAPTPASDTPVLVLEVPGNTSGAGATLGIPGAFAFTTGIAFAIVGGIGDTDNTAVALSDVVVNFGYL